MPFAGHPNIGTAVALARQLQTQAGAPPEQFVFEEAAGHVQIRLLRDDALVVGAELAAPQPLSILSAVSVEDAAACVSLSPREIAAATHPPRVISVGLPFLTVELSSRDALRRARPDTAAHERVLPAIGTDPVFAYVRGSGAGQLYARMFAPLDATVEDPATGSATAATIALLTQLKPEPDADLTWRIEQGLDMGRPSVILGRTHKRDGLVSAVYIAGHAVCVMHGVLRMPSG